jgi:hypothetical protein
MVVVSAGRMLEEGWVGVDQVAEFSFLVRPREVQQFGHTA